MWHAILLRVSFLRCSKSNGLLQTEELSITIRSAQWRLRWERIRIESAPKALGPYSQGISVNSGWVFVLGQLPLDPLTHQLVTGEIGTMTLQVIKNIQEILKMAGGILHM